MTNDTISRQAAIDWASKIPIHDLSDGRGFCRVIFADDFLKALKTIPLAQSRWIPCSERLPEGGRVVLVTEKGGFIRHCEYANYCDFQEFQTVEEGLTVHDVIAWMPLPEPYKGEKS